MAYKPFGQGTPDFDITKVGKLMEYQDRTPAIRATVANLNQGLYGNALENFNKYIQMYPSMDKDLIVAAVKKGIPPTTVGVSKIATIDGLNNLINKNADLQNASTMAKKDRNIGQVIQDNVYAGFKGTIRTGFAAIQHPYQAVTNLFRNAYAVKNGEIGIDEAVTNTATTFFGLSKNTNIGAMATDLIAGKGVDAGTGFFVGNESKVGKAQRDAMTAYGKVGGNSFTIGRATLSGIGSHPDSTFYKVSSGVIDAVFNIAFDPTLWVGPGSVTKVIRSGKELKETAFIAKEVSGEMSATEKELRAISAQLKKDATKQKTGIRRTYVDNVEVAKTRIADRERALLTAEEERALKILTSGTSHAKNAASEMAKVTIGDDALGSILNDALQQGKDGDIVQQFGRLSADNINSGKLFDGDLIYDEVPSMGNVNFAAAGDREFVTTVVGEKPLNIVDITKPVNVADEKELARWVKFVNVLQKAAVNKKTPQATRDALGEIAGTPANVIKSADDKLIAPALFEQISLLNVLSKAIETGDAGVSNIIVNAIKSTWKADGFSNIRAVKGGTGGVVVTNAERIAAREVKVSEYLAKARNPRLAATTLNNLSDNIVYAEKSLKNAEKMHLDAIAKRKEFDTRIREIIAMRKGELSDPTALNKYLNDPENIGMSQYHDLRGDITTYEDALKEMIRVEAGIVSAYGGELAPKLDKVLTYVLGKRFQPILKLLAEETSALRIKRLFNNKMPISMVQEIADAETVGQIEKIFIKYMTSLDTNPEKFKSLALSVAGRESLQKIIETTARPLVNVVPTHNFTALQWAEKAQRTLGSLYVRTVVLPLDDLDRLVNGLDTWMKSAGLADNVTEALINEVMKASTPQQRSGAVMRALQDSYGEMARQVTARNPQHYDKALKAIKDSFLQVKGKDDVVLRAYSTQKITGDSQVTGMISAGKVMDISAETAHHEYQMLDDVIQLPDSRAIKSLLNKYNKMAVLGKSKEAYDVLSAGLGDKWRTAQLAFRAAFIIRNVGEMQVRMYMSGHESLFNHPLQFIAMMAANPNGTGMQKLAASMAKYQNDLLGVNFADDTLTKGVNEAIDGHFEMLNRMMYSYSAGNKWTGKVYRIVDSTSDRYHVALANTVSNFHGDRFIAAVARANTPEAQEEVLQNFVNWGGKGKVSDALVDLILGGKTNGKSDYGFFAEAFLLKPPTTGKISIADVTPDNINVENLRRWLFNTEPNSASIINDLNALTGGNDYLRILIGEGSVTMPNGKVINAPKFKQQMLDGTLPAQATRKEQGKTFKQDLISAFPASEMKGSTAIYNETITRFERGGDMAFLNKAVDYFFDIGTRVENIAVYGPEYRMAFWDHAGKYSSMLSTKELQEAYKMAVKTLSPIRKGNKALGKRHPVIRAMEKELKAREKGKISNEGLITLRQMNSMSSRAASNYTKNLFYDAAKQNNIAAQWRLIFPFAQAQFDTINKWAQLGLKNPVKIYKFGRAFNALTQPGSSAIYDLTGVEYDDNQGFFYKDGFGEYRFRFPLAGSIMGGLVGRNLDASKMSEALQFTAPVQSLNLAFGAVNPMVPGIGPVGQLGLKITGQDEAFGAVPEFLRRYISPFGISDNQSTIESLFPSWLNKSFQGFVNNDTAVNRNLKPWAEYLASTGDYGDNVLADEEARTELFKDARHMAKWTYVLQGFFQSIAPATPKQEVFAQDKDGVMHTQTYLYNAWNEHVQNNPGDYFGAVRDFSDQFGAKNLLIILGTSTRATNGTADAWDFLNNHPNMADKYSKKDQDIVPYFFPGGESAIAYYNWQKRTSRREIKSQQEMEADARYIVYEMAKSQISEEQATYGRPNYWYVQKLAELGTPPASSISTNVAENKIDSVGKALKEPAFQDSSIYEDTQIFYDAFKERQDRLNFVRTSNSAGMTSNTFLANTFQEELEDLANQIINRNPAFSRMYYGVFAGQLKDKG
jgi:hypothetical protein